MSTKTLDAKLVARLFLAGADELRSQKEKIAKIAPKHDSSGKTAGTVRKGVLMPRMRKKRKVREEMLG